MASYTSISPTWASKRACASRGTDTLYRVPSLSRSRYSSLTSQRRSVTRSRSIDLAMSESQNASLSSTSPSVYSFAESIVRTTLFSRMCWCRALRGIPASPLLRQRSTSRLVNSSLLIGPLTLLTPRPGYMLPSSVTRTRARIEHLRAPSKGASALRMSVARSPGP